MFCVTEAQAATIRATFEQRGELSAVVELRRLFPGIANMAVARQCVQAIVGWQLTQTRSATRSGFYRRKQAVPVGHPNAIAAQEG